MEGKGEKGRGKRKWESRSAGARGPTLAKDGPGIYLSSIVI